MFFKVYPNKLRYLGHIVKQEYKKFRFAGAKNKLGEEMKIKGMLIFAIQFRRNEKYIGTPASVFSRKGISHLT